MRLHSQRESNGEARQYSAVVSGDRQDS
ncbi:hypothetical protein JMJ77_0012554 [Colletotrichum scovillei]|uniref:Uncharacterized protein n=1 Tax=Colletotrichum scovillei TaxID=1209932 RepID=A0A9P7R766_9PEZI|nr:hypothetical protein JMJ77_0012554 [Colletotrichum scovillei]KAG7068832.1 hypothetical protein JMJ76_0002512 [Colletotrichum scovillei]KAG7072788.1 hypothetical protein JMJ78_0013773 [Colletotrichum scovillei]